MCETVANLLFVLTGGLLGFGGSLILDSVRRRQRRKDFICGVLVEFSVLKFKMALVNFGLHQSLCSLPDELFEWLLPLVDGYEGPLKNTPVAKAMRELAALNLEERTALAEATRDSKKSPRMATFSIPFVEYNIAAVSLCSPVLQNRILEIKNQLEYYNQEVTFLLNMLAKTFEPNLEEFTKTAIETNIENGYRNLADRGRQIADLISELEEHANPGST